MCMKRHEHMNKQFFSQYRICSIQFNYIGLLIRKKLTLIKEIWKISAVVKIISYLSAASTVWLPKSLYSKSHTVAILIRISKFIRFEIIPKKTHFKCYDFIHTVWAKQKQVLKMFSIVLNKDRWAIQFNNQIKTKNINVF